MKKLSKVIEELSPEDFRAIESRLQQNNAAKFLGLFRHYRNGNTSKDLLNELGVSSGALYALKSRLYDRIQSYLSGNLFSSSDQVLLKLQEIPDMCHRQPREIAVAFLLKLEKELRQLDMHNELVLVYSALKKMSLFGPDYFHYSQQYNKHVAFNLSVEKSEEILGNFNRVLRQYDLSREKQHLDRLEFLRMEIGQHHALHQSRQIGIIRCVVEAQLGIFCPNQDDPVPVGEKLDECTRLIEELPESSPIKHWQFCVDYLQFEWLLRTEKWQAAAQAYKKVRDARTYLMLSGNVVTCSFFPISEQMLHRRGEEAAPPPDDLKHDPEDMHAGIQLQYAAALHHYYRGSLREAAKNLNQVLNRYSLRDEFHVSLEIRLFLLHIYIKMRDEEFAANLLRNLARKIKSDQQDYKNVLNLLNVFSDAINRGSKGTVDMAEQFILFEARNKGRVEVLRPLLPDLRKMYQN